MDQRFSPENDCANSGDAQLKRRANPETGISPSADCTVSKAVASKNKKAQSGSSAIEGIPVLVQVQVDASGP